jgi:hypothetical protein
VPFEFPEFPENLPNDQNVLLEIAAPTNNESSFSQIIQDTGTIISNSTILNKNLTLIYVHVGKTGGTTLDSVLRSNCEWYETRPGKRKKCLKKLQLNRLEESMVSKVTKATTHTDPRHDFKHQMSQTNGFLVTVRNPISRVVSAFNTEHPRNALAKKKNAANLENVHINLRKFYLNCFPTVEDLAQSLLAYYNTRNNNNTTSDAAAEECYLLGANTLQGRGNPFVASHLRTNYAFYAKYTFEPHPERPVLVARTEYLWEDMKRIDQSFLGGAGVFAKDGSAFTHGSIKKRTVRDGLSPLGKEVVCCYIANELSIYEGLVRGALNLSPLEKEQTMSQVYQDCGLTNSSLLAPGQSAALERLLKPDGAKHTILSFPWEAWARGSDSGCPR